METCKINLFKIYNSTISSFSKALSNFSNSSSKLILVSIKSTKLERDLQLILESLGQFLEGDLQLILESLGQFLLTKINLSKFFDCKQHLLKLVRTLQNENILYVSI